MGIAQDEEQRRLWANLVIIHAWLLRDLLDACRRHAAVPARGQAERSKGITTLMETVFKLMNVLAKELQRSDASIAYALVRSNSLQCYSHLLAAWPPSVSVEPVLLSAIQACGTCGVAAARETAKADRTGLYVEWAAALADSQLLEHIARLLVRVEEEEATEQQENELAGTILSASNDAMDTALGSLEAPLRYAEVRRLLSGLPGPYQAPMAELVAVWPAVRSVLSGPCLQYWLGRRLLVAELRAAGTASCHGLPDPSRLVAAPWAMGAGPDAERCLSSRLRQAATAWFITVSVPSDLNEALAAAGAEAAGGGDGGAALSVALAAAAEARGRHPPAWRVAGDGMPYSAAHVYDLTHGALAAALREGTGPASIQLLRPTVLLVRLALEQLGPAAAAARLPGLWRVALSFLRSFDAAEALLPVHNTYPDLTTCMCYMGRLLRLEQRGAAPLSAGSGAQAEAAGTAAAEAPAPGCSFSLRCALEAGFLPAVEQLLRRLAALPDDRAAELFLYAVNCLLRGSGVWPAVLAHGSVREVTSLILTLRKATCATSGVVLDCISMAEDENLVMQLPRPQAEGYQQGLGGVYIAALLEQLYAARSTLGDTEPLPHDDAAAGSACSSGAGNGDADRYLALNYALGACCFAGHGWLVRAGGQPTHGSPAAEQQRMLASFALAHWLPVAGALVGPGALWSPLVERVRSACLTSVARQCIDANLRLSQPLAAPGSTADGSTACPASVERQEWLDLFLGNTYSVDRLISQLREALSSQPVRGGVKIWSFWLRQTELVFAVSPLDLALHLAHRLLECCAADPGEATAPCPGSPQGTVSAITAWAAAAVAVAEHSVDATAAVEQLADVGGACTHASADVGTSLAPSLPSTETPIGRARRLRRLLLQGGWGRLVVVLDAAVPLLTVEAEASGEAETEVEAGRGLGEGGGPCASGPGGGDIEGAGGAAASRPARGGGGVPGNNAAAARCALIALLDSMALEALQYCESEGLAELLPPPAAGLHAAKEAGVVPCGNPGCGNLEGPSEAALSCRKTCSRCRAVSYCSGACQLAHWQAGHREGCPAGSAAPSGSGSGG